MPRLIWVFAGCTCQFVGFVMRQLICLESLMGWAMYWGRGTATKSYKTCPDSSVSKMVCFRTSYILLPRGFPVWFWGQDMGSDCISSWSLLIFLLWVALAMNIHRYVWIDDCHSFRWFHRVFPGYMAETYIGFPPSLKTGRAAPLLYSPVICNHVSYGPEE